MQDTFELELVGAEATEKFGAALAHILIAEQCLPQVQGFTGRFSPTRTTTFAGGHHVAGLFLTGDLGSGKTTFARGFVKAMPCGDRADVASPSFALCNVYDTLPPILHCDVYRTEGLLMEDLENALDDTFPFVIVEWAALIPAHLLPPNRLEIFFTGENDRRHVCLRPFGAWALRACTQCMSMEELTI